MTRQDFVSLISIRDLRKKFSPHQARPGRRILYQELYDGLNLDVVTQDWLTVLGQSGCGKSSLLKILSELDSNFIGTYIRKPNIKFAHVFQDARLLAWLTVEENLKLPVTIGGQLKGLDSQKLNLDFELKRVRLDPDRVKKLFPHELSGGMRFRVSLARALIQQPDVLFLDEPFSALDEVTREELGQELRQIWIEAQTNRPLSIVLVTHSLSEAVQFSKRILFLGQNGRQIDAFENPYFNKQLAEHERHQLFIKIKEDLRLKLISSEKD